MQRLLLVSVVVLGCGTSPPAPSDPFASPDPDGASLCPDCQPCATCVAASGGETTDFGGGTDPCLDFVDYPDGGEVDDERIRALLPQVEGTFVAPLQWQVRAGDQVRGFADVTEMTITSHVDRAWYAVSKAAPVACSPPSIALDMSLRVQTSDGALSGELHRFLLLSEQPFANVNDFGRITLSLSEFSGTLDGQLDATRPHQGWLSLRVELIPGYGLIAGNLVVRVEYTDAPQEVALEMFADWPSGWVATANDTRDQAPFLQRVQDFARDAGLEPL